jgi:cation diffusion facilitator family transporter
MRTGAPIEIPDKIEKTLRRARRVQSLSLAGMISTAIVVYFTLGQSQAMKAIWVEDLLGIIPPAAYLATSRIRWHEPTERFPYGYQGAVAIASLASAVVLTVLGFLVFADSLRVLLMKEHPTIGVVGVFGRQIWLGWIMIPALVYTICVEFGVSLLKAPLASELHDTTLAADARMNRADWMTGTTGIIGVIGIAFGLWWMDSLAALLISVEIIRDGIENLKNVIADLMYERPDKAHEDEDTGWGKDLIERLKQLEWVSDADVRLREHGNLFTGEVYVVPRSTEDVTKRYAELQTVAHEVDWRFHDLSLTFMEEL